MTSSSDSTRKTLAIVLLVVILAPFAAVLTHFLFNNTFLTVGVLILFFLSYFPMKWIMNLATKEASK